MRTTALLAAAAAFCHTALAVPAATTEQLNAIVKRAEADIPTCASKYAPGGDAQRAAANFPQSQSATTTTTCPTNQTQVIQIPVYVVLPYFVYPNGTKEGYIAKDDLLSPVKRMQANFAKYTPRVNFTILAPTYKPIKNLTLWQEMHNSGTDTQADMDRLLRTIVRPVRGSFASKPADHMRRLYVYLPPSLSSATAFAFLPYDTNPFEADGVYFDARDWLRSYSTLTHETGHWMSLLHNFQGGCQNQNGGDLVNDTPPWVLDGNLYSSMCMDAKKYWGYPYDFNKIANPCGGTKGQAITSIANFMNYSFDICKTSFTKGQQTRYWNALTKLRGFKPTCKRI
ncbi:hypothetical protein OIV83_005568 [Microbotryomycetes sp. JL201]|nr:hypothetical protein OIV83_005568 [Microbotryomycetes sp. JL201]